MKSNPNDPDELAAKKKRLQRIEAVFQKACSLKPGLRDSFLRNIAEMEPDIVEEAELLLNCDTGSDTRLGSVVASATECAESADPVPLGTQLGQYQLKQEIGRGGMGTIFLAERMDDEFHHKVAVKIIRSSWASQDTYLRFRAERQILANLDHPHIGKLLDGGTTPQGLPYLVMEYINGVPIDQYCDRERLSITKRLELFLKVCSAVSYAHRNLIVHRDLKPSNILVTDDGIPKLLDFGIAKLLDEADRADTIPITQTRMNPMTLEYASPEQVRGLSITTSSDVYSLGVILFQLLTSHLPYTVNGSQYFELQRLICEADPVPPSQSLKTNNRSMEYQKEPNDSLETICKNRNGLFQSIFRQLSGDLDNIVLMALRRSVDRRYGSVGEFSADVKRYLRRLPVKAQQDSLLYRSQKFLTRNKLATAVSFLLMVAIISFAITAQIQASRIARERDTANYQRDKAQKESKKSEAISSFLNDMLTSVKPGESLGGDVSVKEILNHASKQLESEDSVLNHQPEVGANIHRTLGTTYRELGQYKQALGHLEKAYQMHRELLGAVHHETLVTAQQLAFLYERQGLYDKAEPIYMEVLTNFRKNLGEGHQETITAIKHLGALEWRKGNLEKAKPLMFEAYTRLRDEFGEEHSKTLGALNNVILLKCEQSTDSDCEKQSRLLVESYTKVLGSDHPRTLGVKSNLVSVYFEQKRFEKAEKLIREVLQDRIKQLGAVHPDTLDAISNLAGILASQHKFSEAETNFKKALEIKIELLGKEHPNTLESVNGLAWVYREVGKLDKAEELLHRYLTQHRPRSKKPLPITAMMLNQLGKIYLEQELFLQAKTRLLEALEIRTLLLGEDNANTLFSRYLLAKVYAGLGLYQEVVKLLQPRLETYQTVWGNEGEELLDFKLIMAIAYKHLDRYAEAERLAVPAFTESQNLLGSKHEITKSFGQFLDELYRQWKQPNKASGYPVQIDE